MKREKVDWRLTYFLHGLSRHFKGGKRKRVSKYAVVQYIKHRGIPIKSTGKRKPTPLVIVVGKVTAVSDSGWRCK